MSLDTPQTRKYLTTKEKIKWLVGYKEELEEELKSIIERIRKLEEGVLDF